VSISAFLRNTVEIVQISTLLEKQKRFYNMLFIFYSSIVSYLLFVKVYISDCLGGKDRKILEKNGPAIAEPFQFSANPIIPKGRLLINIKGVISS